MVSLWKKLSIAACGICFSVVAPPLPLASVPAAGPLFFGPSPCHTVCCGLVCSRYLGTTQTACGRFAWTCLSLPRYMSSPRLRPAKTCLDLPRLSPPKQLVPSGWLKGRLLVVLDKFHTTLWSSFGDVPRGFGRVYIARLLLQGGRLQYAWWVAQRGRALPITRTQT